MATPHRPSLLYRAMSTPPTTPTPTSAGHKDPKRPSPLLAAPVLTPPASPRRSRSSSHLAHGIVTSTETPQPASHFRLPLGGARLEPLHSKGATAQNPAECAPLECPFQVEILKDDCNRDQVFGSGAWGVVYKATTHFELKSASGFVTPPRSPALLEPVLVAVKKPLRRDAVVILQSEAQVLTHLMSVPDNRDYVVPFLGLFDESSLVFQALPFSLEDHIKKCASQSVSTWDMSEPVVGNSKKWLQLAHHTISALSWLHHEAGVVHGDIKPSNILLSHTADGETELGFLPLLADFSSSLLLNAPEATPNTLSAVTREYTAPELLSSAVLRDPKSTPTTASDVFSMAVTLIVAATGQTMVYPGSVFQRQAMATQGWHVLDYTRNGVQGTRVPRQGVVQRTLERAVLRAGMGRIDAENWLQIVEEQMQGEPTKV